MATIGHIACGLAGTRVLHRRGAIPGYGVAALVLCGLSCLPDADVIAFRFGIPYDHPFGHRGASHSLAFAALVGAGAWLWTRNALVAAVTGMVVVSHGLLDACTDGGLGIAFFWPLDDTRYFFPWRPLPVAPIGRGLLSSRGAYVLLFELACFAPLLAWAAWTPTTALRD